MIIVVDTNVLISALFWRGQLRAFYDLINTQQAKLAFSFDTIDELYRVVRYPHINNRAFEQGIDAIKLV